MLGSSIRSSSARIARASSGVSAWITRRNLCSRPTCLEVTVPRTRENGSAADVLGRYRRRSADIDEGILAAYVSGASTRDVGGITEALVGERVSRSAVSRVTATLGEKVEQLRKAPITGPIPYLFLDATFIDARWARKVENVSALVAYGIGVDGHRQLLAVTIGAEESEDSGSELLAQLLERGLAGVQLVVADAHAGIAKAVRSHLPPRLTPPGTCSRRHLNACARAAPARRTSQRKCRPLRGSRPAGAKTCVWGDFAIGEARVQRVSFRTCVPSRPSCSS